MKMVFSCDETEDVCAMPLATMDVSEGRRTRYDSLVELCRVEEVNLVLSTASYGLEDHELFLNTSPRGFCHQTKPGHSARWIPGLSQSDCSCYILTPSFFNLRNRRKHFGVHFGLFY